MTPGMIGFAIGIIIGAFFGFSVGGVTIADIMKGGIRMGQAPEKYMPKIDFRKYFPGGVIPEHFKYPRPEATTTEAWKNKTADEIFSEIQAMREKIESIRPSPVAYAGKKAYAAIKKNTMYDPKILQIEESDALPDDAVFIPAKSTIIKYTGE